MGPSHSTRIGIVVVLYRSVALPPIIEALCSRAEVTCVVVDNSGDLVSSPSSVKAIRVARNTGYPAAVNLALLNLPDCDAILLVNPDVDGDPQALMRLAQVAANISPPVICAPLAEGEPLGWQPKPSYGSTIRGYVTRKHAGSRASERYLSGAILSLNRPARQLLCRSGELLRDDLFFMDDIELCDRAKASGVLLRCVPVGELHHAGGGTSRTNAAPRVYFSRISKIRYWRGVSRFRGDLLAAFFLLEASCGFLYCSVGVRLGMHVEPGAIRGFRLVVRWILTRDLTNDAAALR